MVNTGDTAWILTSAALVLLMTPGLALFYGGMVRAKSVLNMMMMSFGALALISVLWVLYGYSLSFGNDVGGGLLGNGGEFFGLKGLMEDTTTEGGGLPTMAFVGFQAVFAIITVALISGAIADRAKFGAWMVFAGVWATIVYFPVAHWVFDLATTTGPRRRLDRQQAGGHRLRRWYGGAHQRRCGGPGARPGPRQAARLRPRGDAPAQPAAGHDRRRPAVVRLVRLQRRLGARRQQHRVRRLGQHAGRHRCGDARLAAGREVPGRPLDLAGCCLRRRRRPGRHHAGLFRGLADRRDHRGRRGRCRCAPWPSA